MATSHQMDLLWFAIAALIITHVVKWLIGWMSGEESGDTLREWADTFLSFFPVIELDWFGQLLNKIGLDSFPKRIGTIIALICLVMFIISGCESEKSEDIRDRAREHQSG